MMQHHRGGNMDGGHDGIASTCSVGRVRFTGRQVLPFLTALLFIDSLAETADAQQFQRGLPGIPTLPSNNRAGAGSSSVQSRPAPTPGQIAPTPNTGPVTGYGPGGTGHSPGAPINPPLPLSASDNRRSTQSAARPMREERVFTPR
jgi:hypothetical protein